MFGFVMVSDFLVIGGGMAGASAGYFLAASGSVTLLEMESAPGYHSTGRSAALFSEYYGNRAVRALTTASRQFFAAPPPGFGGPLLTPRGVLTLCPAGADERFATVLAEGLTAPTPVREIEIGEVPQYCPIVRPGWYSRAMVKPAAMDVDVNAVHQGFLRRIRARGGRVLTSAKVRGLARRAGLWRAVSDLGELGAPTVVNAGGAWADELARLADVRQIGLTPRRRTAFLADPPDGVQAAGWPMVADVTETFYFKPESGALLISPADATPVPPGDARPDDLDVAIAAERVQEATTLVIRHVRHAWAGLRSSVWDDSPVVGEAPDAAGFIWLAALSGYGVQTAPAVGRIAAALATSAQRRDYPAYPGDFGDLGIDLDDIAPGRCFG